VDIGGARLLPDYQIIVNMAQLSRFWNRQERGGF